MDVDDIFPDAIDALGVCVMEIDAPEGLDDVAVHFDEVIDDLVVDDDAAAFCGNVTTDSVGDFVIVVGELLDRLRNKFEDEDE